jgi:hypothetical protein
MSLRIASPPRHKNYVLHSTLLLLAFATAFFSRLIDTMGAPAFINFIHFLFIPWATVSLLLRAPLISRKQVTVSNALMVGLGLLLSVMLISALLNQAGAINVLLYFLMLAEPIIFLVGLISLPLSAGLIERLHRWFLYFGFINLGLCILQYFIIVPYFRSYLPNESLGDHDMIQGVFFVSGGSAPVAASVSILFGLYFLNEVKQVATWQKYALLLTVFWQMIVGDAKAVILIMMLSWLILSLTKYKHLDRLIQYGTLAIFIAGGLWWCIHNFDAFSSFQQKLDLSLYASDSTFMIRRMASINLISQYQDSIFHHLFGLGPGHTVSRLGGWMIEKYADLLKPLGVTSHPVSQEVWATTIDLSWGGVVGRVSTFFSPFWTWAGIWGDIGLLGVATYLYLGYVIWHHLCLDDISKIALLRTGLSGFILTQMEEPGIMLFTVLLIALQWHRRRFKMIPKSSLDQWSDIKLGQVQP